jgi:hypothetical protein
VLEMSLEDRERIAFDVMDRRGEKSVADAG